VGPFKHRQKGIEPLAVETQTGEIEVNGLPIKQAHYHRLAETGRHRADPQVQLLALNPQHDPAILGQAPLGDVQARHDFQPGDHRSRRAGRWRFGFVKHAVDAIAHFQLAFERLDVDVRGALLDGPLQDQVDQPNHRRFRGQVLQVFDVFGRAVVVVEGFDQRADGAAALAVIAFDEGVDIVARPYRQPHRHLTAIGDGFEGVWLAGVGGGHEQTVFAPRQRHHLEMPHEALGQGRQGIEHVGRSVEGQERRLQQRRPGPGHFRFRHQPEASQQWQQPGAFGFSHQPPRPLQISSLQAGVRRQPGADLLGVRNLQLSGVERV
jgi:hypothetical protein